MFSLFLGKFKEYPDLFVQDDVPDRVSAKKSMAVSAWGVYSGMGDQRIQRHIEDHVHRHLNRVAERTFEFSKDKGIERLILAAPDERTVSLLKDHLHSYLKQRVLGEFHARPDDAEQRLQEKALDTKREIEEREQEKLLDRLMDLHLSAGLGVVGLQPVLDALRMGQIHTLVMKDDFTASGYLCPKDRYLSAGASSCPVCGKALQPVERLPEEMLQEALAQGAEILYASVEHADFDPHGIGALLRFRV